MAQAGQYTFSLNPTNNGEPVNTVARAQSRNKSISFSFLKPFTKNRVPEDGQVPRRRGPKPDAKPALTRRQQLNRQAQRTHRERKEQYIKNLEEEVHRLKQEVSTVSHERDSYAKENQRLREALESRGITSPIELTTNTPTSGDNSNASMSGVYAPGTNPSDPSPAATFSLIDHSISDPAQFGPIGRPIDYDQSGIDFVLALERPCMDHMQMLCAKSQTTQDICGHTLMATCPPQNNFIDHPDFQYPHQMDSRFNNHDLMRLLDLSDRLPLDGEITPVMAWAAMRKHPRFFELSLEDLAIITANLLVRVRCYGFGAVLEEFEVQDAVTFLFDAKSKQR